MTDSNDSVRPYGFLLIRYYQSTNQVPEMAVNPETIAHCFDAPAQYETQHQIFIVLKDGTKLRLWTYSKVLKDIIAEIDIAMRERLLPPPTGDRDLKV